MQQWPLRFEACLPPWPPAESAIDNTVSVTLALALADSFDVLPDGKCAGRRVNNGMRDGGRVQLRSTTVGGSVWSVASAHIEYIPPPMRHGKPLFEDDGLYCFVKAVFVPQRPDATSTYDLQFEGGNWRGGLKLGRAPFGQRDRPGYGSVIANVMTCNSLQDPPEKDCPEWANSNAPGGSGRGRQLRRGPVPGTPLFPAGFHAGNPLLLRVAPSEHLGEDREVVAFVCRVDFRGEHRRTGVAKNVGAGGVYPAD